MPLYVLRPPCSIPDKHSTLAKGLLLDVPCFGPDGATVPDYSGNNRSGTLSGSSWGDGARGRVIVHDATSDRTLFGPGSFLPTQGGTIVVGYRKRDTTNRVAGAFGYGFFDVDDRTMRCGAHVPFSDGVVYWDYGGSTEGASRLSVSGLTFGDDLWVFTTGPRGMEVWQNGILRGSNSANPARNSSSQNWGLGQHHGASPLSDLADYWLFRVYDRQLTQREIFLTTIDPWSLYWEQPDEEWIAALADTGEVFAMPLRIQTEGLYVGSYA